MHSIKTKGTMINKGRSTIIDEMSGLAVIKVLDKNTQKHNDAQVKICMKFSYIDITNTGLDTIIFDPEEVLGILDLRS